MEGAALGPGAAAEDTGADEDEDKDDTVEDETVCFRDSDATDDAAAWMAAYEPGTIGMLVAENPEAM
jgi:hypothetical protein